MLKVFRNIVSAAGRPFSVIGRRLLFLVLLSHQAFGQAGSVSLKDGATGTVISTHPSITAAYNAIAGLDKDYVVEINASYTAADEAFPVSFGDKQKPGGIQHYITVRPAANVTALEIADSNELAVFFVGSADYLIIDGRPGGQGTTPVLTLYNKDESATGAGDYTSCLLFGQEYGATYNTVRYCNFRRKPGAKGSSIAIDYLSAGIAIEHCNTKGGQYGIRNMNTEAAFGYDIYSSIGSVVYGCTAEEFSLGGIYLDYLYSAFVDSCIIRSLPGMSFVQGVVTEHAFDTVAFTRNRIELHVGNGGSAEGMHLGGEYTHNGITGNMISIDASGALFNDLTGIGFHYPNQSAVMSNNTIRLSAGAPSGSGISTGISIVPLPPGGHYFIHAKSNIIDNEITGGSGYSHLCLRQAAAADTAILRMDYNTYYAASGNVINKVATGVVYTAANFGNWQSGAGVLGNEQHSNIRQVYFQSPTDLHLDNPSIGDTFLRGLYLADVPVDIDGESKAPIHPYRGADEAAIGLLLCSGTPNGGTVSANDSDICTGSSVLLQLKNASVIIGIGFQWQSATGTGAFVDIPGATGHQLTITPLTTTRYRCVLTCQSSGLSAASAPLEIVVSNAPPSISGIQETHAGSTFTFNSGISATHYYWSFGDGTGDTAAQPVHTYAAGGAYTVTLIATNGCGSDTTTLTVQVPVTGVSVAPSALPGIAVYPNPAKDFVLVENKEGYRISGIALYNSNGLPVYSTARPEASPLWRIDLRELPAGMYFLRVETDKGSAAWQVLVSH